MNSTDKQVNDFDLDKEFFQPVVEAYLHSVDLYKKFFNEEKFDITPQQWHALNRLWKEDGISQAELAKRTFKDYTFTTRLVDYLEKQDLVVRVKDKEDRRSNKVFLTEKGKKFKSIVVPKFIEMSNLTSNGLTENDINDLRRICTKIINNYKNIQK